MAQKRKEANWTSQLGTCAVLLVKIIFLAVLIYFAIVKPPTDKDMAFAFLTIFPVGMMSLSLILALQWGNSWIKYCVLYRTIVRYAFCFSAALLALLLLASQLKLAALSVNDILAIMNLGVIGSAAFFWLYFSKKEDLK